MINKSSILSYGDMDRYGDTHFDYDASIIMKDVLESLIDDVNPQIFDLRSEANEMSARGDRCVASQWKVLTVPRSLVLRLCSTCRVTCRVTWYNMWYDTWYKTCYDA